MQVVQRANYLILSVCLLMLISCSKLPSSRVPDINDLLSQPTATPLPTSMPGLLHFIVPDYDLDLDLDDHVPGAKLVYLSQNFDSENELIFNVLINGVPQVKRVNDSFYWRGIIAPGVQVVYDLRLGRTFSNSIVKATGTVKIDLFNPLPIERDIPGCNDQLLCFKNMIYDTVVRPGDPLPRTSLTFVGQNNQGSLLFTDHAGQHRFYRPADALIWRGQLLNNVFVNHTLRLINIDEAGGLHIQGNSDLRLAP